MPPPPHHACCLPRRPLRYLLSPLPPTVPTLCGFIASLRAQNLPRVQADEHASLLGVPLEQIMRCSLLCLLLELSVGSIFVSRQPLEFPPRPTWEESSVLLCWHFDRQVSGKAGAWLCLDSCIWPAGSGPGSRGGRPGEVRGLACGAPGLGVRTATRPSLRLGCRAQGGVQGPFCLRPSVIPLRCFRVREMP